MVTPVKFALLLFFEKSNGAGKVRGGKAGKLESLDAGRHVSSEAGKPGGNIEMPNPPKIRRTRMP